MGRRYFNVEALLLAQVVPGNVVVLTKAVEQVVATRERITLHFADGTTIDGPPDGGLEILEASLVPAPTQPEPES